MNFHKARPVRRLKSRDLGIVDFVARYRLATVDVLQQCVLPTSSANAVAKLVNRLCVAGYLRKFTLIHPTRYFVLGEAGAKALGLRIGRTDPLGPQSLPIEYAVLLYCAHVHPQRRRLSSEEVCALWPWLPAVLAAAPHCYDEPSQSLELLRVDLGGAADHVARKCAHDIESRRRLPEFSSIVAAGRFRLVVITATKEKSSAIKLALDRHDRPDGLRLHASVIPGLIHFIFGASRA